MMDRMFEQSQKLMNDQVAFWTAQATRTAEQAVAHGEKLMQLGGERVSTVIKEQTALFDAMGRQVSTFAQQQMALFTEAFKGSKA